MFVPVRLEPPLLHPWDVEPDVQRGVLGAEVGPSFGWQLPEAMWQAAPAPLCNLSRPNGQAGVAGE
eukprot:15473608-Alexandrium_andersonii.AAC.1